MPNAVPVACSSPRCPNFVVPGGRGRCAAHARRERPSNAERGYGGDWSERSLEQRRREPRCAACGATSDLVADHVVNGDRRLLQTLCRACNTAKRNRERAPLTAGWPVWHGREIVALMGVPGSGKSTFAASFPLVVTTDDLRSVHAAGAWSDARMNGVYGRAFARIVDALRANRSVVFDSMLANPATRQRLLTIARAMHARATLIVFDTPIATCIARQAGRVAPVPEVEVRERHAALTMQFASLGGEGWTAIEWRREASADGQAAGAHDGGAGVRAGHRSSLQYPKPPTRTLSMRARP
jgi:predicted kinase